MPELPEIERVRRTLEAIVSRSDVLEADLRRRDVLKRRPRGCPVGVALLEGARIAELGRAGKRLSIVAEDGRSVLVGLGMSGQLRVDAEGPVTVPDATHVHMRWRIRDGDGRIWRLSFRDPRRFGGILAFTSPIEREAWIRDRLGPDALDIPAPVLEAAIADSRRAIKAALLDQTTLAGVGNIYADEALHRAGIDPRTPCRKIRGERIGRLAGEIRSVLAEAVAAGGSTLRDYVDAQGNPGGFQTQHRVYGRLGQPCLTCGTPLRGAPVAGRTTVWCSRCQRR